MKKSVLRLLIVLCLAVGMLTISPFAKATVKADGVLQFLGATEVSYDELVKGTVLTGHITASNGANYIDVNNYKLHLEKGGKFEILATGCAMGLYDAQGTELFKIWSGTQSLSYMLNSGDYYLAMLSRIEDTDYTLLMKLTPSEESYVESEAKGNDTVASAEKMTFNKAYKGQLGYKDYFDYYMFTVPADGKVTIKFSVSNPVKGGGIASPYIKFYLADSEDNVLSDSFTLYEVNELSPTFELKKGTYYLRVFNESMGEAGSFYEFKATYKLTSKPSVSSVKRAKNNKSIVVKYKKISGATGYEVSYSTSSDFKKGTVTTVKTNSTSYTINKLNAKKTYYVRIRAYVEKDGKTYSGPYCGKKTVKVNK